MNKLDPEIEIRISKIKADVVDKHPFVPFDPDLNKHPVKPLEIHDVPDLKNFEFSHEYIMEHLEIHSLNPTLCSNCCPATKYFQAPEQFVQKLYEKKHVKWRLLQGASPTIDIPPYKDLKYPLIYPSNIKINHPPNRPWGPIILKRQTLEPSVVEEFCRTARMSSILALKTLQNKPNTAKELTYKLHEDIRNGVLVSLDDFL